MFLHPIKMRKLSFYISKDHIKSILFELGKFKFIEFLNLNHRLRQDDLPFAKELLWLERKKSILDIFMNELEENDIDVAPLSDIVPDLNEIIIIENRDEVKDSTFFENMDDHFSRLQALKAMRDHIHGRLQELNENLKILSLLNEQDLTKKSCMTGIIDSSKLNVLKKILETVFRNNLIFISSNFEDSTVFLIFTHGKDAYEKLIQICTSFGARLYSEQSEDGNTVLVNTEQKQEATEQKEESKDEDESNEKSESDHHNKELGFENTTEPEEEKAEPSPKGGFSTINLFSRFNLSLGGFSKNETKKEDGKDQKNNPNKNEILKVNSLVQQYTHLSESNKVTLHQELYEIKKKLPKWHENIMINIKILKAMNRMKQTTAFVAEGYVPISDMVLFDQLINEICENMGRIAYEDKDDKNNTLLVTGVKANDQEKRLIISNGEDVDRVPSDLYTLSDSEVNSQKVDEHFLKRRTISQDHLQKETANYLESPLQQEDLMIIHDEDDQLSNSLEDLRQAQQEYQPDGNLPEEEIVPTYFKVNQFTGPFQNMNDVYGVPSYTEINPAPFTCITFPFLFGSMFGDVGHGIVLFLIAALFIKFDKIKKYHEMLKLIVDAKYMLMACSLYSIFFGFIYSDFLGLPIKFFKFGNITYFGISPDIHSSPDHLNIMNGLKMKLSVLIGTLHMFTGLVINCLNTFYKKEKLVFFCQTLPKVLSFGCFTGYLFILILIKYIFPFQPSIINTIVSMFTDPFNHENFFYKHQMYVQMSLLALYIICLPWMMVSYPVICFIKQRKSKKRTSQIDQTTQIISQETKDEHHKESLLDIAIHSGIETIEFNLGIISNISSYLRIWAVSLAHNQLTIILHTYTIGGDFSLLVRIITFPFWLAFTFALMICLEGLSASLHSMRLNWIEFNSKFFDGQGRKFQPLCFDEEDEES